MKSRGQYIVIFNKSMDTEKSGAYQMILRILDPCWLILHDENLSKKSDQQKRKKQ